MVMNREGQKKECGVEVIVDYKRTEELVKIFKLK